MTYELRRYVAKEGQLPAVIHRFQNVSLVLFPENGIRGVAYWRPVDTDDTLVYIVEHSGDPTANWAGFLADERWISAKESYGPIVERVETEFLELTLFSAAP